MTPERIAEAKEQFKALLREAGFDPDDPEPDTHEYRYLRDTLLYGNHYDEVDPTTGERRCIPADRVVITTTKEWRP